MRSKKLLAGMLLLMIGQVVQAAAAEPVLVPTPRATVLAVSASSRPFLAATRSQQAVNLAARGYAEVELLVRGQTQASQPFVTRALVRRPQDAGKFSGRVVVEVLSASGAYETAPLWGFSWEHFLRRGDVWVGLTVSTQAVATLQKFDAVRYGTLNLPAGEASGCGTVQPPGSAADVMAQVGALLRSSSKENPLLGLSPQRLIGAGYAGGGDAIAGFAVGPHRSLRLGDGAPIFDGYMNVSGMAAVSAACVAAGLPRGVPFVSVLTSTDVVSVPDHDRGDAQSEGLRVFDITGTDGVRSVAAALPVAADLTVAGVAATATATATASAGCREPLMDQVLAHALNATWQQLDDLLLLKMPLTAEAPGLRVPGALVAVGPRPVCNAVTGSLRFDIPTLKRLYRTRTEYLRRFGVAVDRAVQARLLVKEDAVALKLAAAKLLPVF